jgi:hypothetical protein
VYLIFNGNRTLGLYSFLRDLPDVPVQEGLRAGQAGEEKYLKAGVAHAMRRDHFGKY